METKLAGRKAIVTGSTAGIGFAIARGLAAAGASVVLNGRTETRLSQASDRLKKEVPGADIVGVAADLGELAGINKMIGSVAEADILVNNLGIFEPKPFFEITDSDWEQYIGVNLMAGVRLSRHYASGMVSRGWGRILFNASATGGFVAGEMVHYGTTKTALLGLSRGLAESLAGSGVTVNAFLPGPTRTERVEEFMEKSARASGKSYEQMFTLPSSLLKRFVTPTEVANLVTFLASDQSSAITGAGLRVDGGILRSIF